MQYKYDARQRLQVDRFYWVPYVLGISLLILVILIIGAGGFSNELLLTSLAIVVILGMRFFREQQIKRVYRSGVVVEGTVTDMRFERRRTSIDYEYTLKGMLYGNTGSIPTEWVRKRFREGEKFWVVVEPSRPKLGIIADLYGAPVIDSRIRIERWTPDHPRWGEVLAIPEPDIDLESKKLGFHLGIYTMVALMDEVVAGVLRFWTQEIGIDEEQPVMHYEGKPAIEAKIVIVHVLEQHRRKGIATELQFEALRWAKELDLYQVRSRSDYDKTGNHALKMALGFGVNPGRYTWQGADTSAYFVVPLKLDKRIVEILSHRVL